MTDLHKSERNNSMAISTLATLEDHSEVADASHFDTIIVNNRC